MINIYTKSKCETPGGFGGGSDLAMRMVEEAV
jgi:hypothetical protein